MSIRRIGRFNHNLNYRVFKKVIGSTLTFVGSISPMIFLGASVVLVDCDRTSWNMDPDLLALELELAEDRGQLPKAVVPTDLYGHLFTRGLCLPSGTAMTSEDLDRVIRTIKGVRPL